MGLDGADGALDVTIGIQGLVVELLSTFLYTCVLHIICIHRFATISFSLPVCRLGVCVCSFGRFLLSVCVCEYACKSMLGMGLYARIYIHLHYIHIYI